MSRILLIDDQAATRLVMQNRLEELGYEVLAADNGAKGLMESKEGHFDAVLVDPHLESGVGGLEICRRLKHAPQTAGVPVIFIGKQSSTTEEMRRGFEAGAEFFLPKGMHGILDEVLGVLGRQRVRHEEVVREKRALEDSARRMQEEFQRGADLEVLLEGAGDQALLQREMAAGRPDGLLIVDGAGIVRHRDRGAGDLLGRNLIDKNLGRLAPATGLEAFVRDAHTESRDGFRFDIPERNGRSSRSLTASVAPLVATKPGAGPDMRVVMLTDTGKRRVAAELMRMQEYTIPRREVGVLRDAARIIYGQGSLVGPSPAMARVRELVAHAAKSMTSVLISGPRNSGRQHVARAIHFSSDSGGPFLYLSCSALSEANLESELFGQVKGATPEAVVDRPGIFQQASHGTVYLENVDCLPEHLQKRLLTALRERKITRAGGKRAEAIEVRILAGTRENISNLVAAGSFSKPLYDALSALEIQMLPLSQLTEDIPAMARHFIERFGGGRALTLAPQTVDVLMSHSWPGNVRELAACIEHACRESAGDVIEPSSLPGTVGDRPASSSGGGSVAEPPLRTDVLVPAAPARGAFASRSEVGLQPWEIGPDEPVSLELYEKKALLRALEETGGDRLAAARLLKVGKSTLYRKLKRYEIR